MPHIVSRKFYAFTTLNLASLSRNPKSTLLATRAPTRAPIRNTCWGRRADELSKRHMRFCSPKVGPETLDDFSELEQLRARTLIKGSYVGLHGSPQVC